jgi:phosphoserine phosphatase
VAASPPFAAVWFDCDSTLSAMEGIDELARMGAPDLAARVARLTTQAMEGRVPIADVYAERLCLLAPDARQLAALGELYLARAVPDAREVVAALRHLGKHTGILSGGLLGPVLALARHLDIPSANVHAVAVHARPDGSFADFDRASPLCRNGGKVEVLRALPPTHRPLAFVGDGVTDLETRSTVDCFVGYGGVALRPAVRAGADAWLDTPSLAPLLQLVLTADERRYLADDPRFPPLLSRAGA